jgi:hypothetical protein
MIPSVKSILHTDFVIKERLDDSVTSILDFTKVENPVVEATEYAYRETNLVQVNDEGVKAASRHLYQRMRSERYQPRTWRTMPLHICPPEPYDPSNPLTRSFFDWIFLISSLNFSFWSEYESEQDRFGVEWHEGWENPQSAVWTGYWCLVAAINRALEEGIPFTEPAFYSSETLCPDSLIEYIFRPSPGSKETVPLLKERIKIMRENGAILCDSFGGSFQGFHEAFQRIHNGEGSALGLVQMVSATFPSFQDEVWYHGRRAYLWKRAQILVAESWAAFYPPSINIPHPLFPGSLGPQIERLTMFADYRVPQILHHLRILYYPPSLIRQLEQGEMLENGSREELSIRAASVVAIERVRAEITKLIEDEENGEKLEVNSVLIDFFLWEMAKKVEAGEERVQGIETSEMIPAHRTRSIWY